MGRTDDVPFEGAYQKIYSVTRHNDVRKDRDSQATLFQVVPYSSVANEILSQLEITLTYVLQIFVPTSVGCSSHGSNINHKLTSKVHNEEEHYSTMRYWINPEIEILRQTQHMIVATILR